MNIASFVSGLLFSIFSMIAQKSYLEPMAKKIGEHLFSKVIKDVYQDFDIKWLPENYNKGLSAAYNYLVETCIPEKDDKLKPEEIEKIAQIVLSNFNIVKSLKKLNE